MISASKSTLSLNNLKILRPKDKKNLTNLRKKFCEFSPSQQIHVGIDIEFFGHKTKLESI